MIIEILINILLYAVAIFIVVSPIAVAIARLRHKDYVERGQRTGEW